MIDKSHATAKKSRQTAKKKKITDRKDVFTTICKTDLKVECVKEYRFHPKRLWRFDYAIPEHKIAIEIDGGVWTYGRHNRAQGYLNDLEKFNAAASMGWLVLKFTPEEQYRMATIRLIGQTIKTSANGRDLETNSSIRGL